MSAFELRSGHKLLGWAGWRGWLAGLAGPFGVHVGVHFEVHFGVQLGRRFFAHVLGNIDMLVPREASQEVEFVSKPIVL